MNISIQTLYCHTGGIFGFLVTSMTKDILPQLSEESWLTQTILKIKQNKPHLTDAGV